MYLFSLQKHFDKNKLSLWFSRCLLLCVVTPETCSRSKSKRTIKKENAKQLELNNKAGGTELYGAKRIFKTIYNCDQLLTLWRVCWYIEDIALCAASLLFTSFFFITYFFRMTPWLCTVFVHDLSNYSFISSFWGCGGTSNYPLKAFNIFYVF